MRRVERAVIALVLLSAAMALAALLRHAATPPPGVKREMVSAVLDTEATRLDETTRDQIAHYLVRLEEEFRVDALLLLAVIERESRYDTRARGPNGGQGLMQVRDVAAREIAPKAGLDWGNGGDLFHPEINLRLGTAYLAEMKSAFGRWDWALAGYNIGPTRLRQLLRRGRPAPSVYSHPIIARWTELSERHSVALARSGRPLAVQPVAEDLPVGDSPAPGGESPFGRPGDRVLPSLRPPD